MIPDVLDRWDMGLVQELISKGIFESEQFDFKEKLPASRDEQSKRRLRKTIAAFANSGGGFLVFGVSDNKKTSGNQRLVGLPLSFDFPEQFGSHASFCQPSVEWSFKNSPLKVSDEKVVHIVHILPPWRGLMQSSFSKAI